ncbi:hypothetical protein [Burkholderia gladioli]|uniref:hypothetical protein n=1 Tax=Burkholderia gladioli TaxID=28095 RepID=UPI0034DB2D54
MTNNEKSPAQGEAKTGNSEYAYRDEKQPVTATVRASAAAGNAAQARNTAADLDRDIAHLIECSESGIARVPRETLVRLRALLTSPRAAVPVSATRIERLQHAIEGECDGLGIDEQHARAILEYVDADPATFHVCHDGEDCPACLDAAPAAPSADPLRRRVERLLVELHAEGRLSEGQCAKMLDISRVDWRELAEFLAPSAQAVAADGISAQHCNLGVGCDEAGVCYASAHGDASQCGRAAVSPATAESKCTRCGSSTAQACNELGCFYLESGEGEPATADERAARLDDADIDTIAESMPGGLASFKKQWGRRLFARAVEAEVVLNVARASQAAAPAEAREPFPYQKTFDAIAAATSIVGGHVSISVNAFCEAFGPVPADAGEAVANIENPLTPYGMLVRALRIVANTTLMEMATAMRVSPAFLSSLEFGRRPVTYDNAAFASGFFSDKGIVDTLPALAHAVGLSQGAQGGKGGEA